MTTVGRWMSKAEYEMMAKTGHNYNSLGMPNSGGSTVSIGGGVSIQLANVGAVLLYSLGNSRGSINASPVNASKPVIYDPGSGGKGIPSGGGGTCRNCLDPSTVGQNLLGLSYPGGDNPRTYAGDYSYAYVPERSSEYPAIGHDRRYDNLEIAGIKGLLTDTRAVGADWRFVVEELSIALYPFNNPVTRKQAFILGEGLGLMALPKTIYLLAQPNGQGLIDIITWYNISNVGVTNTPDIHKHKKNQQ